LLTRGTQNVRGALVVLNRVALCMWKWYNDTHTHTHTHTEADPVPLRGLTMYSDKDVSSVVRRGKPQIKNIPDSHQQFRCFAWVSNRSDRIIYNVVRSRISYLNLLYLNLLKFFH
jgi:hypothetical protein